MMLEAVYNLLKIYMSIRPLISLWATACHRTRAAVMDPNKWPAVRDATTGNDVKGTLFDIPPDLPTSQLLKLEEFKLEAIVPHVYVKFIGA